jgi:CPA1 family monovalent cation:H+ antiporter
MGATIETLLLMVAVLVVVAVVARRLHTPPSILWVVAGVGLALIPGLPAITLAPELVLLGILPPLIYSAGVAMSWREFRFNLRPITFLAFGCVVFTTCAVAVAAHWLLGMPWAVAAVLGAIVAPPDVVAPLAIARRVGLPRRIMVVLEGEGLANDATALILYRFAVAAASSGVFSLGRAAGVFVAIVVGEIAWGIVVGLVSLRLRRWARDPRVEIAMSLVTPYLAYWIPEHLGGSGVLATVATGLYVSWNGPLLISSATRLQGIFFWDLIVYLIEGLVFLLTGLQARALIVRASNLSLGEALVAATLTTVIVIVARFMWVFPAAYLPRWLSPSLARRDPAPPWQTAFALAFTGVRGVVSLAAALAIPLTVSSGAAFPYRDLILFVTFGVIVATLVGQGLLLAPVVRWLGLARGRSEERERELAAERAARSASIDEARKRLEQLANERDLPDGLLIPLRARHATRAQQVPRVMSDGSDHAVRVAELRSELIAGERAYLYGLLRDGTITDESRRRLERELDLEEASTASSEEGDGPPL